MDSRATHRHSVGEQIEHPVSGNAVEQFEGDEAALLDRGRDRCRRTAAQAAVHALTAENGSGQARHGGRERYYCSCGQVTVKAVGGDTVDEHGLHSLLEIIAGKSRQREKKLASRDGMLHGEQHPMLQQRGKSSQVGQREGDSEARRFG